MEQKYRVRDPETKEIVAEEELYKNKWRFRRWLGDLDDWSIWNWGVMSLRPCIREQWAGEQLDEVDLYEGDKLEITIDQSYDVQCPPFTVSEHETFVGVIEREKSWWVVRPIDKEISERYGDMTVCELPEHDVEIIGSIHDKEEQ